MFVATHYHTVTYKKPPETRSEFGTKSLRGKKYTPALTVPMVETIIAASFHRALDCGSPAYIKRHNDRVIQRNESAYAYHWKSRNRLAPRRFNQRK